MSHKINLPENHKRAFSSSLLVVERSLIELEEMLAKENDSCCTIIEKDLDEEALANNIAVIHEARRAICDLSGKYGTTPERMGLKRVINAKRTTIWTVLTDSLSKKLKSFGKFPKEYAEEYDSDINRLLEIIHKISF